MERFWIWLREFANNKVMECHLKKSHHSRLCPNCKLWTSETGGAKEFYDKGEYSFMRCNQCDHLSKWIDLGIAAKCVDK